MSKKCNKCRHEVIEVGYCYYCPSCDHNLPSTEVSDISVFDRITSSPEVLAPRFVYFDSSVCDDDGIGYPWCSTLFEDGGHFETEEKAIAATIKELEKVFK